MEEDESAEARLINYRHDKREVWMLGMFRSLNEEGRHLALSTVAAFVNCGSNKARK